MKTINFISINGMDSQLSTLHSPALLVFRRISAKTAGLDSVETNPVAQFPAASSLKALLLADGGFCCFEAATFAFEIVVVFIVVVATNVDVDVDVGVNKIAVVAEDVDATVTIELLDDDFCTSELL